jgi:hypothetical protein
VGRGLDQDWALYKEMKYLVYCKTREYISKSNKEKLMGASYFCVKSDIALVNGVLDIADYGSVQLTQCPKREGKIKSSMCCGPEMNSAV